LMQEREILPFAGDEWLSPISVDCSLIPQSY
jgi:hypothetical protein